MEWCCHLPLTVPVFVITIKMVMIRVLALPQCSVTLTTCICANMEKKSDKLSEDNDGTRVTMYLNLWTYEPIKLHTQLNLVELSYSFY